MEDDDDDNFQEMVYNEDYFQQMVDDDDYYGELEQNFYNTPVDSPSYYYHATKAVCMSGSYLASVPEQYRTSELCLAALRTDTSVIKYIPERLLTYDFYVKAVLNNINSFTFVPENIITHKFITDIYDGKFYYYGAIKHLPKYIGKYIFRYTDVVKNNRRVLDYFPFDYKVDYIPLIKKIMLFNKN